MEDRCIFIDIDGTLTDHPKHGGKAIHSRIVRVRELIRKGERIVIWSGTGLAYARKFAKDNKLEGAVAVIGKPEVCIDDNPGIRPKGLKAIPPEIFFR